MVNRIISSGHGLKVSGASYYIDEVKEARKVVDKVTEICEILDPKGTIKYHENNTTNKTDNLNTIIKYHNSTDRDLDVSIHFNSSTFKDSKGNDLKTVDYAVGTETLYTSNNGKVWAEKLTKAIAKSGGFKDRGAKKRTDLGFLNKTNKPSVLIELCFVNSKEDVRLYNKNFEAICIAIAETLTGKTYASSKPITNKFSFKNGDYNRKARTTANLNIRTERNTSSKIVKTIPKGTVLEVNYCLNNWFSTYDYKYNGKPCYVSGDYLELI